MQKLSTSATGPKYLISGALLIAPIIICIMLFMIADPVIKIKNNTDTFTTASRTEIKAKHSDSGNQYSPVFYFNVDDKEYVCSTRSSSSTKPSENSKIYYNSQNPDVCVSEYELSTLYLIAIALGIASIIDIIIGLFVLITTFSKNAKIKQLAQSGQLIKNIPCAILPSKITLNNTKGYTIELEYEGLKFKSEVKFNQNYIGRETADLLIDPMNTKNYFIDFEISQ